MYNSDGFASQRCPEMGILKGSMHNILENPWTLVILFLCTNQQKLIRQLIGTALKPASYSENPLEMGLRN